MACTTILVGKKASYDGSTMIARNDDSPSGAYMPKKFVVIHPEDQPKVYESVISHVKIELPENPMRYTAMPNAVKGEGIWAASGGNDRRRTGNLSGYIQTWYAATWRSWNRNGTSDNAAPW